MTDRTTFDYIVIGAGSAGCVLAGRLSEDASASVLLLEAGGPADADESKIPAAFASLFKTRFDWNYQTTEQKHLNGQRAYWPRMKALGGCSAMNAMIYIRGNRADYDRWRDEFGAAGWGYDDMLPYFTRAEHNSSRHDRFHGSEGPQYVEDRRYTHELTTAWLQAAVDSGLPANSDFNGTEQVGAGLYQVTCRRGKRWSTADAYLVDRPNLEVRTGALVTRIEIENGRATGVRYVERGREVLVQAGEIILSGGAINSPQLLMLSGVGPANHLREHGIEVAVDAPGVGANLHDHPVVPILTRTRNTTDLAIDLATPFNLIRWQASGTGPLASNVGEGGAFFASDDALTAPDIQVIVAPTGFYDNGLREPVERMLTAGVTLVDVFSRGTLRLRSADPRWRPELDPNYFDDPRDLDATVAGCRRVFEINHSPAIAKHLGSSFLPEGGDALSDEALREHIAQWSQTLYHPVGTCAMGDGEGAVVDPELRVRGVDGLRVADASVMPRIVRGNTNAPVIAIAEKAVDLIRGTKRHPELITTKEQA